MIIRNYPVNKNQTSNINSGGHVSMKTAIILPENLLYLVEKYAEEHGLSRNEICENAISDFIKRHFENKGGGITQKINSVCDEVDTHLDPQMSAISRRVLVNAEW
jgi:metal-responsive CopG/Arc/MetJ family transcriptional regulator